MATSMTKRAFTLVELLVVMGIIAVMATVSIGSYFAVVRGMTDRGAIAGATSVISLAHNRACMDLSPTVVYFYNELVREANKNAGLDAVFAGVAVAVRRAGRVTRVDGDLLFDEFADLNRTYGLMDSPNAPKCETLRLYRFNFGKMEYSSVYSEAVESYTANEKLITAPAKDNLKSASGEEDRGKRLYACAFKRKSGYSNWKVGDAYGYEFARMRLPDNYIFGSQGDLPNASNPIKPLGSPIKCFPDSTASSLESVRITAKRPNGWKAVGDTQREMKDI